MSHISIASYLNTKQPYHPKVGIICGSGLSGLSKHLDKSITINYEDIPDFPEATVAGHFGELVFGLLGNVECVCMRGRFHFYEGNDMTKVVLPVRVMRQLGVKLIIVTNAAGGLNPDFNVGDIMVIQDHFGLPCIAGNTPLRGINDETLGPRFPAVSDAFDEKLQDFVIECSKKLGIEKLIRKDGTYCFVAGPQYESKAESRFLRNAVNGDAVGMSTVPEVLAAKHCGMKILGLSLITNKVVTSKEQKVHATHKEVLKATEKSGKYVEDIVKELFQNAKLLEYLKALPDVPPAPAPKRDYSSFAKLGVLASIVYTISLIVYGK